MNQEYSLQITLSTNHGDAYYYTRVVSRSATYTEQYAKFADDFVQMSLDKTQADNLAAYLETSDSASSRNFAGLNINSPLADISWGNLNPQLSKAGIPVIKDINETTASISIEYEISAQNENGNTEYYLVTDFYKLTCIRYITPDISILRKRCHASVFICKIIYIFASNSQKKSTVADHRKRWIKNLGCRPLKIKQSDSCLVITHSVRIQRVIFGMRELSMILSF